MGKSLVIVESPAKAKTINKYLGNQFVVKSSIGHIRDLPTSGSASASKEPAKRGKAAAAEAPALSPKEKAKRQLFARMGVDPEHGWKAKYEILPGKEKVIEELRRLAKDAEARCAEWLLRHAEPARDAPETLMVMLNQRKRLIAAQLGIAPETLSRVLRHLRERSLISGSGRVFSGVDLNGLRALAGT